MYRINSIRNMNKQNKVINLINLKWQNFDFSEKELSDLKIADGKYKINTINHEGQPINTPIGIFYLMKLGRLI